MLQWIRRALSSGEEANEMSMLRFGGTAAYRDDQANGDSPTQRLCKVLMVGDSGSGKSAFVTRVASSRFYESHCITIGAEFASRTVLLDGTLVKLQLWDTAGQERYRSITHAYYRGCEGIFLTVDVSNPNCLASLPKWLEEIHSMGSKHVPIVLLATKTDCEVAVSLERIRDCAEQHNLLFTSCSSKMSTGVEEAVILLASAMIGLGGQKLSQFAWAPDTPEKHPKKAKTDTNFLNVDLAALGKSVPIATGDPCMCTNCGALLNSLSQLHQGSRNSRHPDGDKTLPCLRAPPLDPDLQYAAEGAGHVEDDRHSDFRVWDCEFCGRRNFLELDADEQPRAAVVDYVVRPKPDHSLAAARNVVFCLDISGSMSCTSTIRGQHQLKGSHKQQQALEQLRKEFGGALLDEQLNSSAGTSVSRLQCVQAAVEEQINQLYRSEPATTVGLVTFNHEVQIIGDGSKTPTTVAGDVLSDWDGLQRLGERHSLELPISASKETLMTSLWDLEADRSTSLGPALLLSIMIAGKCPGSHVVLCTDGQANCGIGAIENQSDQINLAYVQLAELAKVYGVVVSVVSIVGDECRLDHIGRVAEQTGGGIDIVDPRDLVKSSGQLGSLMNKPVLAYGTMAMVTLHRALQFNGEMDDEGEMAIEELNRNFIVKDIGNVTSDSELSLCYRFRQRPGRDFTNFAQVPFQVLLLYTRQDGACHLRVATSMLKVTNDRTRAVEGVSGGLLATHAVKKAAELAKAGRLNDAIAEAERAEQYVRQAELENRQLAELQEIRDTLSSVRSAMCVEIDRHTDRGLSCEQVSLQSEQLDKSSMTFMRAAQAKSSRWW